ncbi:MAG: hypothetical protein ABIN58_03990, partial [candidate division WOR-3 bacterium]
LSEASDLTDLVPRMYVTRDPRRGGRDRIAERALHAVWRKNDADLVLTFACMWALTVGTGFIEVGYDPNLFGGLGDITIEERDPRDVLPDPDAKDDRKWLFRGIETVLDLQEIRRLFPLRGHLVKPEDRYSYRDRAGTMNETGAKLVNMASPLYPDSDTGGQLLGYKKARARVLDFIVDDPSTETVYEPVKDVVNGGFLRDENGNEILQERRVPKYPTGRRIVGANGVILYDGPSPNPKGYSTRLDMGLVRVVLEPTINRFWGQGFIHQTGQLQLSADKLLSLVVENAIRLNNGMVVSVGNTGLDRESFASIPGQMVQINPGSELRIVYPPPMPQDMIQAPWRMLDLQRRILGFQDARAGMPSRGNVSAELTETEISQSQSTTRLRARMLYSVVRRLAEMIFARMCYYYTTERVIPAAEGEEYDPVSWVPLENPDNYSVYVDPASVMVMSRTLVKRLGTVLYKLKAIDRQNLLETLGWPDWAATAKRLDNMEKAAIMAEAMQKNGK